MIGLRAGIKSGIRCGVAGGISADPKAPGGGASNPMASVTRDATSGIYCPSTAAEWTTTLAVAGILSGNPTALYTCQEAAGNLSDPISALTLTAAGTGLTYQQAVAGWARKGLQTTEAGTGRFASTSASLPDPTTTSYLILAYIKVLSAPAATRSILEYGTTSPARLESTLTPRFQVTMPANVATGAADQTGAVRPFVLQHNFTASANAGYSDAEKLVPAFTNTTSGKRLVLGALALSSAATQILLAAFFTGAAAELTSANLKSLDQTLGWTIPWS